MVWCVFPTDDSREIHTKWNKSIAEWAWEMRRGTIFRMNSCFFPHKFAHHKLSIIDIARVYASVYVRLDDQIFRLRFWCSAEIWCDDGYDDLSDVWVELTWMTFTKYDDTMIWRKKAYTQSRSWSADNVNCITHALSLQQGKPLTEKRKKTRNERLTQTNDKPHFGRVKIWRGKSPEQS